MLRLYLPTLPGENEGGVQTAARSHARAHDAGIHESRFPQHDATRQPQRVRIANVMLALLQLAGGALQYPYSRLNLTRAFSSPRYLLQKYDLLSAADHNEFISKALSGFLLVFEVHGCPAVGSRS